MTDLLVDCGFLRHAPGGNMGVWTRVAREIGWDERFKFGSSDHGFAWNAQLAGYRLAYAPDALMQQRFRSTIWATARQHYRYGRSGPQLHARSAEPDWNRPTTGRPSVNGVGCFRTSLSSGAPARPRALGAGGRGEARKDGRQRPRAGAVFVRRRRRRQLHLLEVGISWPPETFLCWKLEGLAAAGMRVTIASRAIFDPDAKLHGVELLPLPRADEVPGRGIVALRLLLSLIRSSTPDVPAALRGQPPSVALAAPALACARPGPRPPDRQLPPLLRVRPDVVHFEWQSGAVYHLPLFRFWRAPVVTSCHGSEVSLYPYVPGHEYWVQRTPEMFEAVAAVHCVSESLRRGVIARGLDADKARVIRQGVDPELFQPNGVRPRTRRHSG